MSTAKRGRIVDPVDIGDGVVIPREVGATSYTPGLVVELTARYDDDAGRYVATHMAVHAKPGHEITGTELRQAAVARMMRIATESAVQHYLERSPGELAATVAAGPTTETLRKVAYVYRLALLLGDAPTGTVAQMLGVPRSTAGRWVTRARDRGYLTVTDPRGTRAE